MSKGVVPTNTEKNTRWAVNTIETWLHSHKRRSNGTFVPNLLRHHKARTIGIGAEIKHTGTTSMEEENLLWERGVLGTGTPLALTCSVFYSEEHTQLKFSQLKHTDSAYLYT